MQQQMYPTDRPMTPQVQIDVNRPPVNFDVHCAPWIKPYLPYLTGIMIDIITRNAAGPVSMHFYNHMSYNNWANNELGQEVANCADFIFLNAGGQQDPNLIARIVPDYVEMRTKFEVALFPQLRNYINPQDLYAFDQTAQVFGGEIQKITNLRNNVQPGASMPPPPRGYQPPAQYAPPGSPIPAQGYQAPPPAAAQGYQAPRPAAAGRDYGTGTAPAATQPVHQPQPAQQYQAPVTPQAPVGNPTPQPAQATAPAGELLVDSDDVIWNPLPDMPHPMLYNPVRAKMAYAISQGNKTTPRAVRTNMDPINYDRHNIATLFGRPPENMHVVKDNGEITDQIKSAAHDALEESQNTDEEFERVEETMGLRKILSAFSLSTAIIDARTEMLARIDRKNPPMVFQSYAQIFNVLVGDKSEYDLIHKFGDSSSYIELREKIVGAAGTASPELITVVTQRLTQLMNEILTDRLSILPLSQDPVNGVEVEDFLEDIAPLLELLKKRGDNGERLYKAFTHDQGKRIRAMFQAPKMNEESGVALHEDLTSGNLTKIWEGREDPPQYTFFGPNVRITLLNVISHDLQISGLPYVGNVISKQNSAVLYNLAESLFQVDDEHLLPDRQLVVTKDGRILEIFEGALVPGTYLLKLFK